MFTSYLLPACWYKLPRPTLALGENIRQSRHDGVTASQQGTEYTVPGYLLRSNNDEKELLAYVTQVIECV